MVKNITILNGHEPTELIPELTKTAKKKGLTVDSIHTADCLIAIGFAGENSVSVIHKNHIVSTKENAFVIRRGNKDTYRAYLLGQIWEQEAPIFADEATLLSDKSANKITTTVLLPLFSVAVPKSLILDVNAYEVNRAFVEKTINFPAVVKKTGAKGKNVWKVNDVEELEQKLRINNELTLIQEYIPNTYDIRVFVFNNKVIAAIKRHSADGFYNNLSQGGRGEKAELTKEERQTCIKAAKVAKLKVAGVDLVRSERGPLVFEVNKSPQMDIFSPFAGFDILEAYCNEVVASLTKNRSQTKDKRS